jgi:CheY-like chemotaxis protein
MTKTILIIDDDPVIIDLITRTLHRAGYETISASDGPTGIQCFQAEKPDLVVLDVAMPEMSGFDVATDIRSIERDENRPHTPIVLLTAYARSFFVSANSETEVDSYLTKPIVPDKLLTHLNKFLIDNSPASPENAR